MASNSNNILYDAVQARREGLESRGLQENPDSYYINQAQNMRSYAPSSPNYLYSVQHAQTLANIERYNKWVDEENRRATREANIANYRQSDEYYERQARAQKNRTASKRKKYLDTESKLNEIETQLAYTTDPTAESQLRTQYNTLKAARDSAKADYEEIKAANKPTTNYLDSVQVAENADQSKVSDKRTAYEKAQKDYDDLLAAQKSGDAAAFKAAHEASGITAWGNTAVLKQAKENLDKAKAEYEMYATTPEAAEKYENMPGIVQAGVRTGKAIASGAARLIPSAVAGIAQAGTTAARGLDALVTSLDLTTDNRVAYAYANNVDYTLNAGAEWKPKVQSITQEQFDAMPENVHNRFDTVEDFNRALSEANYKLQPQGASAMSEQRRDQALEAVKPMYDKSKQLIQEATTGTTGLAKFGLELIPSTVEMAADVAMNRITGINGLANMGVRVFGGSYMDAKEQGADDATATVYGLLNMAVEVGSEMIGGESIVNRLAYRNNGVFSEGIEKAIAKIGDKGTQKLALWAVGGVEEGLEEVMSEAASPLIEAILASDFGEALRENYGEQRAIDYAKAALGGALMSLAGGGATDAISGTVNQIRGNGFTTTTDARLEDINQNYRIDQSPELIGRYNALVDSGKSESDAKKQIKTEERFTKEIADALAQKRTPQQIIEQTNTYEKYAADLDMAREGYVLVDENLNQVGKVVTVNDGGIVIETKSGDKTVKDVAVTANLQGLLDPNSQTAKYLENGARIISQEQFDQLKEEDSKPQQTGQSKQKLTVDNKADVFDNKKYEVRPTADGKFQVFDENGNAMGGVYDTYNEALGLVDQMSQTASESPQNASQSVSPEKGNSTSPQAQNSSETPNEKLNSKQNVNADLYDIYEQEEPRQRRSMTLFENEQEGEENTRQVGNVSYVTDTDSKSIDDIANSAQNYELGGERFSAEDVNKMTAEDVIYRIKAWAKKLKFGGLKGFASKIGAVVTAIQDTSGANYQIEKSFGDVRSKIRTGNARNASSYKKDYTNPNNVSRDAYEASQTREAANENRANSAFMYLLEQDSKGKLSDALAAIIKQEPSHLQASAEHILNNIFKKAGLDVKSATVADGIAALAQSGQVDVAETLGMSEEDIEEIFALLNRAGNIEIRFGKGDFQTLNELLDGDFKATTSNDSRYTEKDFHGESSRAEDIAAINEDIDGLKKAIDILEKQDGNESVIEDLEKQIDQLEKQAGNEAKIQNLEKQVEELRQQSGKNAEIEKLEKQIEQLEQQRERYQAEEKRDSESGDKTIRNTSEEVDQKTAAEEERATQKAVEREHGRKPDLGSISKDNASFVAEENVPDEHKNKGNFSRVRGITVNGKTYYALSSEKRGSYKHIIPDAVVEKALSVYNRLQSAIEQQQEVVNNLEKVVRTYSEGRTAEEQNDYATQLSKARHKLLDLQEKFDKISNERYTFANLWNDKEMPANLRKPINGEPEFADYNLSSIANAVKESDAISGINAMEGVTNGEELSGEPTGVWNETGTDTTEDIRGYGGRAYTQEELDAIERGDITEEELRAAIDEARGNKPAASVGRVLESGGGQNNSQNQERTSDVGNTGENQGTGESWQDRILKRLGLSKRAAAKSEADKVIALLENHEFNTALEDELNDALTNSLSFPSIAANALISLTRKAAQNLTEAATRIGATVTTVSNLYSKNTTDKDLYYVPLHGSDNKGVFVGKVKSKGDAINEDARFKALFKALGKYTSKSNPVRIIISDYVGLTEVDAQTHAASVSKGTAGFFTHNKVKGAIERIIFATDYETAVHEGSHLVCDIYVETLYNRYMSQHPGFDAKVMYEAARVDFGQQIERELKLGFKVLAEKQAKNPNTLSYSTNFQEYLEYVASAYNYDLNNPLERANALEEMYVELSAVTGNGTYSLWIDGKVDFGQAAKGLKQFTGVLTGLQNLFSDDADLQSSIDRIQYGADNDYIYQRRAQAGDLGIIEDANPTRNDFKDYPQGEKWMDAETAEEIATATNEYYEEYDDTNMTQTIDPQHLNQWERPIVNAKQVAGHTSMKTTWDSKNDHSMYEQMKSIKDSVGKHKSIYDTPKLIPKSFGTKAEIRAATERRSNIITMIKGVADGTISVTSLFSYAQTHANMKGTGQYFTPEIVSALQNAAIAEAQAYAEGNPESTRMQDYRHTAANALAYLSKQIENVDKVERDFRMPLNEAAEKYGKADSDKKGFIKAMAEWKNSMEINGSTFWRMLGGFDKSSRNAAYALQKQHDRAVARQIRTMAEAKAYFAAIKAGKGYYEFANGKAKASTKVGGHEVSLLQAVKLKMTMDTLMAQSQDRLESLKGFAIRDTKGNDTFVDVEGELGSKERADWLKELYDGISADIEANESAKAYMDAAVKMFADFSPKLQAEMQKINGFTRTMFDEGQYVPVHYASPDGHKSRDWELISDANSGIQATSIMQNRVRSHGGYAVIDAISKAVDSYISQASNYVGFADFGNQLKILNSDQSIGGKYSNLIRSQYGNSYGRFFDNYVDTINMVKEPSREDLGPLGKALSKSRQRMMQGALVASPSVPIKQVSSYFSSMGVIDPRAVLASFRPVVRASTKGINNPFMNSRMQGSIDPDVSMALDTGWLNRLRNSGKLGAAIVNATNIMDARTVANVYKAAVLDVKFNSGLTDAQIFANGKNLADGLTATGDFLVNAKFEDAVLNTQPIFTRQARNELARTNSEFLKMFSTFRTQQTQNYNRMITTVGEYQAAKANGGDVKAAGKNLKATLAGQITASASLGALSILADMLKHKLKKYKDDDDEISSGKILERWAKNSVEAMAGTTLFGDTLAQIAIDMIEGKTFDKYADKEFYNVPVGSISSIYTACQYVGLLIDDIFNNDAKHLASYTKLAVTNTATMFGIPAANVYTIINAGVQFYADIAGKGSKEYEDIMKAWDAQRTDYGNNLFNAVQSGNQKQADKITNYLYKKATESAKADDVVELGEIEEKYQSSLKSLVQRAGFERLKDGRSDDDDYANMLMTYGGYSENAAYAYVQQRKMELDATNTNGVKYSGMKKAWMKGELSDEQVIEYLQTYGGKDEPDAKKTLATYQRDKAVAEMFADEITGVYDNDVDAYSDLGTAFYDGRISREEYKKALTEIGGKSEADAEKAILNWECKTEYGYKYDEMGTKYNEGIISVEQYKDALIKYGGKDDAGIKSSIMSHLDTQYAGGTKDGTISKADAIAQYTKYTTATKEQATVHFNKQDFKYKYGESFSNKVLKTMLADKKITEKQALDWYMKCNDDATDKKANNWLERTRFENLTGYEAQWSYSSDLYDTYETPPKTGLMTFYEKYGSQFKSAKSFGKVFTTLNDDTKSYPEYHNPNGYDATENQRRVITGMNQLIANGTISYDTAYTIWTEHYGWKANGRNAWSHVRRS